MKKYAFVLLAGSIIGLSACGSDSNTSTQEQIDSAVNAKAAELEAARQAQTDSILNEMARMKADSVAMADSLARAANTSSTTVTRTTTTTKTTKPPTKSTTPASTPKPTTQQEEQKDKFDSRQSGNTTITEEKKQEQKSKFDRRSGNTNNN